LALIQPPLAEETTVEYWMEAQDANNVTGPGVGESEHHTIKIVSEIEKKAEIMNRLMDSLSTMTDDLHDQEKINKDLGEVIQGKTEKSNP
jgi:type III secretion system FlhB-like substrate exporter